MKLKTLAKAVAAVIGIGLASQAFATPSVDGLPNPGVGDGSGTLFMSMIDRTTLTSIYVDLGATVNTFRNSNSSLVNNLKVTSSALQSFISSVGAGDSIGWNIGGLSNSNPDTHDLGMLYSFNPGQPMSAAPGTGNLVADPNSLFNDMYNTSVYVTANGSANPTQTNPQATSANAYHDAQNGTEWGPNAAGIAQFSTEANSLTGNLYTGYLFATDSGFTQTAFDTFTKGKWALTSSQAGGPLDTIAYVAAPSAVPLPAAVWLMGSALLGMVGIGRRKS